MWTNEDHDLLIRVSTVVESIEKRLFGDEDTGELPVMRKRLKVVEDYKNYLFGAIAILSFLMTVFGGMLISHIMTHTEIVTK